MSDWLGAFSSAVASVITIRPPVPLPPAAPVHPSTVRLVNPVGSRPANVSAWLTVPRPIRDPVPVTWRVPASVSPNPTVAPVLRVPPLISRRALPLVLGRTLAAPSRRVPALIEVPPDQ